MKIEEKAIIGGCLGIHQFVHIGYLAMIGGMTRVDRDVPPFCLAEGHPGRLRGLNRIGTVSYTHLTLPTIYSV